MTRPKANYEPKKEALAQIALDLFVEHGYENTTVTQIMHASGLTKAGMYYYYVSKEEILDAAIDIALVRMLAQNRAEMEGCTVEEKMLLFARGAMEPEEMLQKLLRVKESNHDSYAAYRIRERSIHAYIPVMEDILREGAEQGVYQTDYPRQTAEFLVLLSRALTESNMLPNASSSQVALRVRAFLQLCEVWLRPSEAHLRAIADLFESEIVRLEGK